jgi:peptidoglycan biosynthesis protein MviN/MurJ (putative lipid II flippase)
MLNSKKIIIPAVLFLGLAMNISAATVSFVNPLTAKPGTSGDKGLSQIIDEIMGFLLGLAIIVCPVLIIWGGFLIATGSGAEDKTKKGRQIITYACVGFVIIALSSVIKTIILDIVTTK